MPSSISAGVNRASSDAEIVDGNTMLASQLADAIRADGRAIPVVFANTIKTLEPGIYGEAKAAAAALLAQAQAATGGSFADVLLPHLFGEFGEPFYNSGVSTFAHLLATGGEPTIQVDSMLELLHAQDASAVLVDAATAGTNGQLRPAGRKILVSEALALLTAQSERYIGAATVPAFADHFEQQMFNMLRSQIVRAGNWTWPIVRHADPRGYFSELIRADGLGQSSVSSSVPGITRGDHYHVHKIERFLVFQGEARIRIRRLLTDEVHTFDVRGDTPVAIDMPPLCTHNITNIGDGEVLTFFWAADHFDPANPDTYPELVELPTTEVSA
ncbi:MAG: hypothetical protein R2706_07485 [Acidimicrobiales bacterium]